MPSTCGLAADFKSQTTGLGLDSGSFNVDTLILTADAGPFPGIPLFDGLVLSAAFEQAQASGNEYVLGDYEDSGTPTLAEYPFFLDPSLIGSFTNRALNVTRDSWTLGFKYPLSHNAELHADWFYNQYTWSDVPSFDRREEIWRLTYAITF
jgi:hypothetical protein